MGDFLRVSEKATWGRHKKKFESHCCKLLLNLVKLGQVKISQLACLQIEYSVTNIGISVIYHYLNSQILIDGKFYSSKSIIG